MEFDGRIDPRVLEQNNKLYGAGTELVARRHGGSTCTGWNKEDGS